MCRAPVDLDLQHMRTYALQGSTPGPAGLRVSRGVRQPKISTRNEQGIET